MTKTNTQDLRTVKRRIILPDDIKKLLILATEVKQLASGVKLMATDVAQMTSKAADHEGRLILLETAPEQPKSVAAAEPVPQSETLQQLPTIIRTAAKTKRKPVLPIEIPPSLLPDPVRVPSSHSHPPAEPFGRSVNDPTESISRKYMNADQLHAAKKSTRI